MNSTDRTSCPKLITIPLVVLETFIRSIITLIFTSIGTIMDDITKRLITTPSLDTLVGETKNGIISKSKTLNWRRFVLFRQGEVISPCITPLNNKTVLHRASLRFDIPIAVCYRRVNILEKAGLLKGTSTLLTQEGKRVVTYKSNLLSPTILYDRDEMKVHLELTSQSDRGKSGSWDVLGGDNS